MPQNKNLSLCRKLKTQDGSVHGFRGCWVSSLLSVPDISFLNPEKAIPLSFDLGNLSAFDSNPLSAGSLTDETSIREIARDSTQLLINEILNLPRTRTTDGTYIQLPAATTPLPREKPVIKFLTPS
jgi:Ribosome biogenesis regulatory protein (RRS1)